jgi:hypothetical protein
MQKTEANQEALQALDVRCKRLMESIVIPLKGKQESQISVELKDSLGRLAKYVCSISSLSNVSHTTPTGDCTHFMTNQEHLHQENCWL